MSRIPNVFLLSLLGLVTLPVFALPEDAQKNMNISADSTLFDYKNGLNIYEGNVHVDQGESHLTSEKLTTQNDPHHKMEEAVAYGNDKTLAHYWTIPKPGDTPMHAHAKIIHFFPQKSQVVLMGAVFVKQGSNSFQGEYMEYNIKAQTVSVPPLKKSRSTIIIDTNSTKIS